MSNTSTNCLLRFWADFNDTEGDDNDLIWVSLADFVSTGAVVVNALLELYDFEGNTCLAFVVRHEGVGVVCKLDLSSWTSPNP